MHPLDAELNLPEEKHSHGLRKLAAVESARGSIEAAGAVVTRATGVTDRETAAGGAGPPLPPPTWRRSTCARDQPGPC